MHIFWSGWHTVRTIKIEPVRYLFSGGGGPNAERIRI